MAVESHVIYAAGEAGWSKRLLLVVEGAASRGSRTGPETAGFVEEQQSQPVHLLVVPWRRLAAVGADDRIEEKPAV